MKKIFSFVAIFATMLALSAQSQVLFDYTAKEDVLETGYDWVENAETVAYSGNYIPGKNLSNPIIDDNYGLAVRAFNVPSDRATNFAIRFINPQFNSSAGVIKNAGNIKSMDVTLILNRGYDEVSVVWVQNGVEHSQKLTEKNANGTVQSMTEFTAHIDFESYISDVRNRNIKQIPVAGTNTTDIYLKEFRVTTNISSAAWSYSPVCIVGIKKVEIVADKSVTDEAYELGRQSDEIFNVKDDEAKKNKLKNEIEVKKLAIEREKNLMAAEQKGEN